VSNPRAPAAALVGRPAVLAGDGAHEANTSGLAIGALGVVYGDIGTSPLYALRECVNGPHGVAATPANILGLLSLVFWSLTLVVVVKYLVFILRADNKGEGGVLALMALIAPKQGGTATRGRAAAVYLGLFGAALLYGDGIITPVISIMPAIEGLEVVAPELAYLVVPVTSLILVGLFLVQRRGTGAIGAIFGPVMLVWFMSLAIIGLPAILRRPEVLAALNPYHAVRFFLRHGLHGFLVLGAVVLCVTGSEALYADMGHFGRRAIRRAWYGVVFPALVINYFGQGALLLERPEAAGNPFYALVEGGPWFYPMMVMATLAAVIAAQALISGAYSLTRQAVQLGYSPRVTIVHTSGRSEGQIFVPEVTWMLLVGSLALTIGFGHSERLAAAYGIAVTGTMVVTSLLFFVAARERWGWSLARAGALLALFLVVDLAFLGANLAKIADGGWVPIVIALGGFTVMTTWKKGRSIVAARIAASTLPLKSFVEQLAGDRPHRVPGTAVFMSSTARGTPNVLLHFLKHNKILHERVIILTVVTEDVPEVPAAARIHFRDFGEGVWAATAHYGFRESPRVGEILRLCRQAGIPVRDHETSFFLGRETLVRAAHPTMAGWRRRLFAFLSRNAKPPTDFFKIPPNRVLEIGTQVEL
jgi:KUP system potassium uptake protein